MSDCPFLSFFEHNQFASISRAEFLFVAIVTILKDSVNIIGSNHIWYHFFVFVFFVVNSVGKKFCTDGESGWEGRKKRKERRKKGILEGFERGVFWVSYLNFLFRQMLNLCW